MNDTSTAAYRLLSLTALSGECSPDILSRLGIGPSYGEKLVTKLKDEGLLKTHYKDRLRGYRLACGGKKLRRPGNLSGCPCPSSTTQGRSRNWARRP